MLIDDSPKNFQIAHGMNMDDVIHHYEWKCQSAWQLHQVFEVCNAIAISYDLMLCYGTGMQSQLCKTKYIFGSKIYISVVVLACFAICTSFSISLYQGCSPYMLLLKNWWNQVSPFKHDIDNEITNYIHSTWYSDHVTIHWHVMALC